MKKKKELTLPELQARHRKCVFCSASNKYADGGYFADKFVCRDCTRSFIEIWQLIEVH